MANNRKDELRKELLRRELDSRVKQESVLQMLGRNAKEAFSEAVSPLAKGASMALSGGAIEAATKRYAPEVGNYIFKEPESLEGQAASLYTQGLGFMQGAPMALGRAITSRIGPKAVSTSLGQAMTRGGMAAAKKAARLAMLREAGAAGIGGMAITAEQPEGVFGIEGDNSLEARAARGALSGIVVPVSAMASKGLKDVGRFLKRISPNKNPELLPRLPAREAVAAQTAKAKQIRGAEMEKIKQVSANELKDAQQELRNITKDTEKFLQKSAERGSAITQKEIPAFSGRAVDTYGKALDAAAARLSKEDHHGLINTEVKSLLDDVLEKAAARELPPSPALEAIKNLRDSYASDVVTPVDLKRLHSQITNITKASFKGKPASNTDITPALLKESWGNLLEKRAPELAKINPLYRDFVKIRLKSYEVFKPGKEYSSKMGTQFLKRVGKPAEAGGLEAGERAFLRDIEKGVPGLAQGVGDISSKTSLANARLLELAKRGELLPEQFNKITQVRLAPIQKSLEQRLAQLSKREANIIERTSGKAIREAILRNILRATVIGGGAETVRRTIRGGNR